MVFSSIIFLFIFLPSVLLLYYTLPRSLQNSLLLLSSLVFYAWGEGQYVLIMLFSIAMNYFVGLGLAKAQGKHRQLLLAIGIVLNFLPLLFFKYSAFLLLNLHSLVGGVVPLPAESLKVHLPAGISFFTFQSVSYVVDIYRGTTAPQKHVIRLGLYISLFPQLIAGPIVRYHDIVSQIARRHVSIEGFAEGVERFVLGLGKKVLIANPLGNVADIIFGQPVEMLSTPLAWLGIVSYSLQIYFDFSGYSDMAIGLGRMFGFTYLENFKYPYISKTLREFWTRWHISLSSWFRDYLYIPLGGNRGGSWRTAFNLLTVFFLCGLWHGASWNFVLWGLFHGAFLFLERGVFGGFLKRVPAVISHIYVLLVVSIAWVFFRAETPTQALAFLGKMFDCSSLKQLSPDVLINLNGYFAFIFFLAVIFSMPVRQMLHKWGTCQKSDAEATRPLSLCGYVLKTGVLSSILLLVSMSLATGSYNPFIYFRF